MIPEVFRKNPLTASIGGVLLLAGAAFFVFGNRDFTLRSVGLVAVMAAAWTFQRLRRSQKLYPTAVADPLLRPDRRIGPLAWTLAAVSVIATAIGYYFLRLEAVHGYRDVWPVYWFAGSGLVATISIAFIVTKLMS